MTREQLQKQQELEKKLDELRKIYKRTTESNKSWVKSLADKIKAEYRQKYNVESL